MKATLYIEIDFDDDMTDAESMACALDQLMKTALSTPRILEEYGEPKIGEFFVLPTEELQLAVKSMEKIAEQVEGLKPALPALRRIV